jgi:hypothetical protein
MVGDVRRQMGLVEPFGDWMGLAAGSPVTARRAVGCLDTWLRNGIRLPRRHARGVGDARPTPISVPAASVAGRALRVPSGSACGRPFPRPAAAGSGGLWEARGRVDGGRPSVGGPLWGRKLTRRGTSRRGSLIEPTHLGVGGGTPPSRDRAPVPARTPGPARWSTSQAGTVTDCPSITVFSAGSTRGQLLFSASASITMMPLGPRT